MQKNCNYGECTDADSLRYLLGKIIYVPFHPNSGYGRIIVKSIIRILLPNATTLKIYLNLKSGLIIPLGKDSWGIYVLHIYAHVIHSFASTCYLHLSYLAFYQSDASKDGLALDV